jgi:hypothetical protein
MTIREQIIQAVQTLMAGINGQAPYLTEVEEVFAHDLSPSDEITSDIVIGVFSRTFQIQRNLTRLSHGIDCPAILILGIRAVIRAGADEIDLKKSNLIADVGVAIFQTLNLGIANNNAVRIENLSFEQEQISLSGSGALGTFLASLQVNFLLDPTQP